MSSEAVSADQVDQVDQHIGTEMALVIDGMFGMTEISAPYNGIDEPAECRMPTPTCRILHIGCPIDKLITNINNLPGTPMKRLIGKHIIIYAGCQFTLVKFEDSTDGASAKHVGPKIMLNCSQNGKHVTRSIDTWNVPVKSLVEFVAYCDGFVQDAWINTVELQHLCLLTSTCKAIKMKSKQDTENLTSRLARLARLTSRLSNT